MLQKHLIDMLSLSSSEIGTFGNQSNHAVFRFYDRDDPIQRGVLFGVCNEAMIIRKEPTASDPRTRVGIGTDAVRSNATLDVHGTIITSNIDTYNFGNTLFFSQKNLSGISNINFTGKLYENGTLFKTSQWTTTTPLQDIVFPGNVGVGTADPIGNRLYIDGSVYISGAIRASDYIDNGGTIGAQRILSLYTTDIGSSYKTLQTNDATAINRVLFSTTLTPGNYLIHASVPFKNLSGMIAVDTYNWATIGLYKSTPEGFSDALTPIVSTPLFAIGSANENDVDIASLSWYVTLSDSPANYIIAVAGKGHVLRFGPYGGRYAKMNIVPVRGIGADDKIQVRNALQTQAARYNQVLGVAQQQFAMLMPGNYTAVASNADVFVNGSKKIAGVDYSMTSTYDGVNGRTEFVVQLATTAQIGDKVDIQVSPSVTTETFFGSGYLYQSFGNVYSTPWMNVIGGGVRVGERVIIDGDVFVRGQVYSSCNTAAFTGGTFLYTGNETLNVLSNVIGTTNLIDGAVTISKTNFASGNLGIGTLNPITRVHVGSFFPGESNYPHASLLLQNNNTNGEAAVLFKTSQLGNQSWAVGIDQGTRFGIHYGLDTNLLSNITERVTIQSDGNLGIGSTAPMQRLAVQGSAYVSGVIRTGDIVNTYANSNLTTYATAGITVQSTSTSGIIVSSAIITTTGKPVFVTSTGDARFNGIGLTQYLVLERDGNVIGNRVYLSSPSLTGVTNYFVPFSLTHIDSPPAGTYTYQVRAVPAGGTGSLTYGANTGPSLLNHKPSMILMEML